MLGLVQPDHTEVVSGNAGVFDFIYQAFYTQTSAATPTQCG